MRARRSFALLLTLYLVALVAASGASLAFTAMTETVLANFSGNDLDHRLLIDGLVACLPHRLRQDAAEARPKSGNQTAGPQVLKFPGGQVAFIAEPQRDKLLAASQPQAAQLGARLEQLARDHGLGAGHIRLRAIVEDVEALQRYYWFDQVIDVNEFEEVFRWRFYPPKENAGERPSSWSDLISFWNVPSGELYSVEVETTVGSDTRRWFLVAQVESAKARVVCLQPI